MIDVMALLYTMLGSAALLATLLLVVQGATGLFASPEDHIRQRETETDAEADLGVRRE